MDRAPLNVAVIGAGVAGLTAAHWLVKGGATVTLIEKSRAIGGRASTLVRDGFYLNQGPHALYRAGAAYSMLTELNLVPTGASPLFKNPIAIYDKQFFDFPINIGLLVKTGLLNIVEKIELAALLVALPRVNTENLLTVSFEDWLNKAVKHAKVRQVLAAITRLSTYSNNPHVMSAASAIKQLVRAQAGVFYLNHGWQTIVDSLYLTIKDSTRLLLDAQVTAIQSKVDGVDITVNGMAKTFDAVVLAIPPKQVLQLLTANWKLPSLQELIPSRAACLDVCLKSLPVPGNSFALGIDEPLYYSVHSRTAELAKPGEAMIHVAKYLRADEVADERSEARLITLLDELQPNWQSQLVFKRYLPDMNASFGTDRADSAGHTGVAVPALPGVPNVYVCGDWVGSGHMLVDAAVSSARAAVKLVLVQVKSASATQLRS